MAPNKPLIPFQLRLEPHQHAFHRIYNPSKTGENAPDFLREGQEKFGLVILASALDGTDLEAHPDIVVREPRDKFDDPDDIRNFGTVNVRGARRPQVQDSSGWQVLRLYLDELDYTNQSRDMVFRDRRIQLEGVTFRLGEKARRMGQPWKPTTLILAPSKITLL